MDRSVWILGGVALVLIILLLNYSRIKDYIWPSNYAIAELMGEKNSILDKIAELIRGDYAKISQELSAWLVDTIEGGNPTKVEDAVKIDDGTAEFEKVVITLSFNVYLLRLSVSVPYVIKNVALVEAVLQRAINRHGGDIPPKLGAIVRELKKLIDLKNRLAKTPLHRDVSKDLKNFTEEIKRLV